MKIIRYILFPIVPVYYFITWLRNKLYDLGIKKSSVYNFPVICVGNLSVGGTGKTPMIEYLIKLLKDNKKVVFSFIISLKILLELLWMQIGDMVLNVYRI